MSEFEVGDRPRTTYAPTLVSTGGAVDPPYVLLVIGKPDGTISVSQYGETGQDYPVTRAAAGVYYADIPIGDIDGEPLQLWVVRWVSYDETSSPMDASVKSFRARKLLDSPLPVPV